MKKFLITITCAMLSVFTSAQAHHNKTRSKPKQVFIHVPNVGIATWYGNGKYKNKNGFHHYTSDGERFDPRAMTCAHLNMPFNTIVRVVDLTTGKYVVVRVNDRMVARPPHIVDLTLAAARALGIEKRGKTIVKFEPVEVAEAPKLKNP